MRTAKTLIRLGAHSLCWFCHVAAHILVLNPFSIFSVFQQIKVRVYYIRINALVQYSAVL